MLPQAVHRYPIRTIIAVVVLAGTLAGIVATGAITYVAARARLVGQLERDAIGLAKESLAKTSASVDAASADSVVQVERALGAGTDRQRLQAALAAVRQRDDMVGQSFCAVTGDGVSVTDASCEPVSPANLKGRAYGDPRKEGAQVLIPFSAPLSFTVDGQPVALRGDIALSRLSGSFDASHLADTSGGSGTLLRARSYTVLSTRGFVLYSTKRYPLFSEYATKSFAAMAGSRQQGRLSGTYRGAANSFSAYAYELPDGSLPQAPIMLVVEQNIGGIVAAVQRIVAANLVLMSIFSGIQLIVLWLVVREVVTEPLGSLVAAANRVEVGEFDVRLQSAGRNEVAALTRSFMRMARSQEQTVSRISRLNTEMTLASKLLRHDVSNRLVYFSYSVKKLLKGDALPPESREALRDMGSIATATIRFIEDSQKLISGEAGSGLSEYRLAKVAEEVAKLEPGIDVRVSGKATVLADNAVYSLLNNIIHNAVVHGGVSLVTVAIIRTGGSVEVRVGDQGKGISDAAKSRLFSEGYIHGATGHTGIGLYAARQIMRRYKGEIRIEDNKPRGTVFVLTFPGIPPSA